MRAALPLALAVALFGASFGVLSQGAGFPPMAAMVMSATTFAGSAQLASVSVISGGGSVATASAAAAMLNSRYAPIGVSVAEALRGPIWKRFLLAQLVVDESWAISRRAGGVDRRLLVGAGAALYAAWLGGTAVGVLGGSLVTDPGRLGLDAAFPALFLALLVAQLRSRHAVAAALLGAAIALALTPLAPPGVPVVCSCAAVLVGIRRR